MAIGKEKERRPMLAPEREAVRSSPKEALKAGKEVREQIRQERPARPEAGVVSRASEAPSGRLRQGLQTAGQAATAPLQSRAEGQAMREEAEEEEVYPEGSRGWRLGRLNLALPDLSE